MYGSEIYNDFSNDIYWIRERIQEDTHLFPDSLKPLVDYYIKKRLIIIPDKSHPIPNHYIDYELARPVPYATFWFADAFGIENKLITRKLGLGLVYSALATTIRDDIVDRESPTDPRCFKLYNYYNHRYLAIFDDLFDRESKFWYYLTNCIKEQAQYEKWNLLFDNALGVDPFSESFLQESSRYFTAVVLPTLAALAVITNNESKIPKVDEFLRHFSMGWRIYDDLSDWQKDLINDNFNHSSILLYIFQKIQRDNNLNEEIVLSAFLSHEIFEKAYGAILSFNNAAKRDVSDFNCAYLSKFMDEQISFHTRKRDSILAHVSELNSEFFKQLNIILNK